MFGSKPSGMIMQVIDIQLKVVLECDCNRVGFIANDWLIGKLMKYGINHTVFRNYVFIDKSNPKYGKLFNKQRFGKLRPVMLVENKFKDEFKGREIIVFDGLSIVVL